MKLKSLILNLTKEGILNLISLQDKILIDNLELNNECCEYRFHMFQQMCDCYLYILNFCLHIQSV